MRRDFKVEGSTHLVRLISRSREDRVQDFYIPRKYRTPYRGFSAVYDGRRGATLQIIFKRSDGMVENDVEKQIPGMDSYQ
eukprot:8814360-Karenia_brevis.AAC.1